MQKSGIYILIEHELFYCSCLVSFTTLASFTIRLKEQFKRKAAYGREQWNLKKKKKGSLHNRNSTQGDTKDYIKCIGSCGVEIPHLSINKVYILFPRIRRTPATAELPLLHLLYAQICSENTNMSWIYTAANWTGKPNLMLDNCLTVAQCSLIKIQYIIAKL